MKSKERLYILIHISTDQICAISEYEEFIVNYINLFKDYFSDNYEIQKIVNTNKINKYLIEYNEYHLYQRGNNNKLTLTEWEWDYYKDIFRTLYERMKDTIINLKMFGDIFEYYSNNQLISIGCEPLSELLYELSENMYEFIGNLPIEYIQTYILREPIMAHEDNSRLLDLQYNYFIQNILK